MRIFALIGAAVGLLVVAVVAIVAFVPFPVSVDGRMVNVRVGTPVSSLVSQQVLRAHGGDLVAIGTYKVLRAGGGQPAVVMVGGKPATPDTRIWPGSVVSSSDGTNVVEPVTTTRVAIPIEAKYLGHGPLVFMSQPGAVGLKQVSKGTISGTVVTSKVLIDPSPAVFIRSAYGGQGKKIALTFDDGPWPGSTLAILKILGTFKIKATFFEIGGQAYRRPELSKAVVAAGMSIGNHSETHQMLGSLPQKRVAWQIASAQKVIERASGVRPTWFRPPGGSLSRIVYAEANANHVRLMLWDIDPNDWRRPPTKTIISRVVSHAHPGAVILMHDGGGNRANTVAALPTIIKDLQAMGYQFVTLDQLFGSRNTGTG